jgi:uncharacterized SAM-binding protein YcdF (DUF218 family)
VTGLEASLARGVARPVRKRPRRRLLSSLVVAALLVLGLLAFRQQVLIRLGESLVVSDPLEHADLIYVFAGDFWGSRVLLGANLGSKGWAPRVILSGGRYQNVYACDLSVDFAVQHGYPRSLFLPIRMEAQSTVDEARAMGPIFHRLGAKRIILVTSNFHSRRAEQVFRLFLPEFEFQMQGSAEGDFDPQAWWKTPQQRQLWFSEYQKIMGTVLVRFHLATADWLRRIQQ